MVLLKPFRGLRPPPELVARVAAPPYDVVSASEARALAHGNPHSFFHISRPEIDLPIETDEHAPEVYAQGAKALDGFRAQGWLAREAAAVFYVYRQRMGTHVQTGLVAAASVDAYDQGLIKKHELTRQDKEDDRTEHIERLLANDEPVFLTYRAQPTLDALISQVTAGTPEYDFTATDDVQHTFWVVPQGLTFTLEQAFTAVPALYVADGHHRSAAASRVRRRLAAQAAQFPGAAEFLTVAFPHDQLQILAYNRLVKDLNGLTVESLGLRLRDKFEFTVGRGQKPGAVHQFGMYLDGQWYQLTARSGAFGSSATEVLDVSILQTHVLGPLLGIGDPRTDGRIAFVGGIKGHAALEQQVDSGAYRVAFSLYPTTLEQLMAIADAGEIMPPKSTWFEPKLRSGLVVHPFL